jgi:hypothetical protein
MSISIISIIIVMAILWLLVEILSVVLKMTGLDLNKARFQVISILTHTGFTTRESELIAQHSTRRKIASWLMIVSYVAQITIITLSVNILTQNEKQLLPLGILLFACLVFIIVLTRTRYIYSKFNRLVEKMFSRRLKKQRKSIDKILKVSPGYGVFEFVLDDDNPYCNLKLSDAKLSHLQVHILKVERGARTIDFPDADFVLQQGDKLVLYGKTDSVTQIALGSLEEAK